MKARALEIVASLPEAASSRNVLREYVQSRILGSIQEAGAMVPLAFMGGTALRFLYSLPRFSEDLDFALERNREAFSSRDLLSRIDVDLRREGYTISMRVNDQPIVNKALIGFVGLLAEADLSPHAEEVLWVRLDVDTDPPMGSGLAVTLVDRFGPLRLQHHDLPSLFAGKLAAVLAREFTKGRDLYDLMWYLMRDEPVKPNIELLANALDQVAPTMTTEARDDWKAAVRSKLEGVDWDDARRDVAPFLEQRRDLELIAGATFETLLEGP